MVRTSLPVVAVERFAVLLCCASLAAAQGPFLDNQTDIPQGAPHNAGYSESIAFGDVDLDGDWDVAIADGGDFGNQQNRIWINQGPSDLGIFVDETSTRFPSVLDASRDIKLVDFDGDDIVDAYVSNHSTQVAQPCRWWRNVGGGFFVDETATRWVGLGGPGSSISPGWVLPGGGFIDFVGDSDFADLDNDGDLDLIHSTYGSAFNGTVPTRIFLNDGVGFFSEFNPSGVQLVGASIPEGTPGLWCQGVQQSNTVDATGQFCDIATDGLDVDTGDVDGDFDLDILLGARFNSPRLFRNELANTPASLSFRDVTGASFAPGYVAGNGHYEQEFGDMDGDGDLDIYGINWLVNGFQYNDVTVRNDGTGFFGAVYTVPSSAPDDEEADFIDFDNDGDLDVFVASWPGKDRLYRNDGGMTTSLVHVGSLLPNSISNLVSRDGQVCDVDGDGDYDVITATNFGQRNVYLENQGGVPDTHEPYIPNTEQAPDRIAGTAPTVLRAHVYDNAPSYITASNATQLAYTVNGGAPLFVDARWSGGQVFRAELPGNLVGNVCYRWISADEYGNTGMSGDRCFVGSAPGPTGTPYCFGDGSGVACPCSNTGSPGHGCSNGAFATGSSLGAVGTASVSADTLVLQASSSTPGQPGLFFQGTTAPNGGNGIPFGDGLRCTGGSAKRIQTRVANGAGATSSTVSVSVAGAVSAGDTRFYQWYYRDPATSPCGALFNLSNGVEITWVP